MGSLDVTLARSIPDEALISRADRAAYMLNVCTAPAARRRGVGRAMVHAAVAAADDFGAFAATGAVHAPLWDRARLYSRLASCSRVLTPLHACRRVCAVRAPHGGERDRAAAVRELRFRAGAGGDLESGALPRALP